MHFPHITEGDLIGALAVIVVLAALVVWLVLRPKLTPEEIEQARRRFLVQSGRIVDGVLLDIHTVEAPPRNKQEESRNLLLLLFSYRIGGVDYECSQDITELGAAVNAEYLSVGFPCSVRYQPGNPQNSIVVAEGWSGLRSGRTALPPLEDPSQPDRHRD